MGNKVRLGWPFRNEGISPPWWWGMRRDGGTEGVKGSLGYKFLCPAQSFWVHGIGRVLKAKLKKTLGSWAPISGERKELGPWGHTESSAKVCFKGLGSFCQKKPWVVMCVYTKGKSRDTRGVWAWSKPQPCCFQPVWPWESPFASLNLVFHEIEIRISASGS